MSPGLQLQSLVGSPYCSCKLTRVRRTGAVRGVAREELDPLDLRPAREQAGLAVSDPAGLQRQPVACGGRPGGVSVLPVGVAAEGSANHPAQKDGLFEPGGVSTLRLEWPFQ